MRTSQNRRTFRLPPIPRPIPPAPSKPIPLAAIPLAAILALAAAGCDPSARRDAENERGSRLYQAAAADYQAGRIDAAADGFAAAVRDDPANAEARFQLACLLHDARKDLSGAYCAYREYLLQHPDGDKAALARSRLAMCERELASELAEKHGLKAGGLPQEAADSLRKEAGEAKARVAALESELAEAKKSLESSAEERKRLLAMINGDDSEILSASSRPSPREIKDLLDEEESEGGAPSPAGDVEAMRREEAAELALGGPLLSPRSADETAALKKSAEGAKKREEAAKAAPERPETYEIREGDTLYKIAVRFYGTIQAWRRIRDANKALISTDGRVKAGDTIRLP